MKSIPTAVIFASELFDAAITAAQAGKAHSIVWEFEDGGSIEFEMRVSKVNGQRMSRALLREIFKGAPRPNGRR